MEKLRVYKVHASENDYFLVDTRESFLTLTQLKILAKRLCHWTSGLLDGACGLIAITEASPGNALAKMHVFDHDGQEKTLCGNGLCAAARYLSEKSEQELFQIETMFADLKAKRAGEFHQNVPAFQVEISPVSFDPEAFDVRKKDRIIDQILPELSETIRFSAVAAPNPHLIAFVDHQTLLSEEFEKIAALVTHPNPLFSQKMILSFVEILGENDLFVRTYEEGTGYISTCGTAMCASALLYDLLYQRRFYEEITVRNAGGIVKTIVHETAEGSYWMELIGNATITHQISGEIDAFFGDFSKTEVLETGEQAAYINFLEEMRK
jgi:diaminopimelate epimerase